MGLPCGVFQRKLCTGHGYFPHQDASGEYWLPSSSFFSPVPLFFSDTVLTIVTIIGITVISVHGLNILTGYCGQISMGHAGFMAVGGYMSAILCAKLGWSFLAALPCGALAQDWWG